MKIELVNTVTSERTDLRFVGGLHIRLIGDVSPEVRAAFAELVRERERLGRLIVPSQGVSVEQIILLMDRDAPA